MISTSVPEFIHKLFSILQNNLYSSIITWAQNGTQIVIYNSKLLQKHILPLYFRHTQIKSFIRQLNMYGFRKIKTNIRNKEFCYFKNQYFNRQKRQLLRFIGRKGRTIKENKENKQQQMIQKYGQQRYNLSNKLMCIYEQILMLQNKHGSMGMDLSKIKEICKQIIKDVDEVMVNEQRKEMIEQVEMDRFNEQEISRWFEMSQA